MLIAAGQEAWLNKRILSRRPLVFVGLVSYPLYLWHWPLLSFLRITEAGDPSNVLIFIAITLSFLLAWLTYRLVEKPIRHSSSPLVVLILVFLIAVLGGTGKIIKKRGGLPDRSSVAHYKDFDAQLIREPATEATCVDYVNGLGINRRFYYCRSNNLQSDKWLAVIGDSHADVLFHGFAEEALLEGYGAILLANSGCPTLLGTAKGKTETERAQCAEKIEQIVRIVSQEERIAKVLIVTRGPVSFAGHGFGVAEKSLTNIPMYSFPENNMKNMPSSEIFLAGLKKTVSEFQRRKKDVIYFLENPEIGLLPKDCLGRPFGFEKKQPSFQVDYDVYRARMADYRSGVFQLANEDPGLLILDPEPLFCDKEACRGIINGQLMYADDDHLSVAGSRYVAKTMAPLLFRN